MEETHEFYCSVDADGRCPECVKRICAPFLAAARIITKCKEEILREVGGLNVCLSCGKKHFDFGLSKAIGAAFGDLPPEMALGMAHALIGYAQRALGVQAMPLSEKALRDVTQAH